MAKKDMKHNIVVKPGDAAVDTMGYDSVTFGATAATAAAMTFAITHGDTSTSLVAIDAKDYVGPTTTESTTSATIGYQGIKRYVKCTVTGPTSPTVVAILGHPDLAPTE